MNIYHARRALLLVALIGAFAASPVSAQGIDLKTSATVYFGSASTCSQPATIDFARVRNVTPEWQTIRSEGVRRGTARYTLLMSEMAGRVQRACRKVAEDAGRDCVVGRRDIKNDNGLKVKDVTSDVVGMLESGEVTP